MREYKGRTFSDKDFNLFWSKVNITTQDRCWYWKDEHSTSKSGYGRIRIKDMLFHSNRASYLFYYGMLDSELLVLHSPGCVRIAIDNFGDGKKSRLCCNPLHLRQGTHKENSEDTKSQGRMKGIFEKGCLPANAGDRSNFAKLSKEQALSIKNDPRSTKDISKEYGVSDTLVTRIKAGTRWRILSALG